MARCTATSKRTGERCKKQAMRGRTVCYIHGGKTPVGSGLPQFKHGRYSKYLPARLLERYEEARKDPELLGLREEIALLDARLTELLRQMDGDESGRLWGELVAAWSRLEEEQASGNGVGQAFASVGELIRRGKRDWQIWPEIYDLWERRRKLVESERHRLVEMQQMITAEQAMILVARVVDVVRRHIGDRDVLSAIGADIAGLIAVPAGAGADRGEGSD